MNLLALETSCDETSAAVISDGVVLSNIVSSQTDLHAEYGGVVPELATREHVRNLPPVVTAALKRANLAASDLNAVAATRGPGLPNALLAGFKTAQGLAFALNVPFLGIHHHEAHLYSPWISAPNPNLNLNPNPSLKADFDSFQPNVALVVSGGHTILAHVRGELDHVVLGSTLDDAAGECFDKTAKLIGLPYPGGPEMDRLAAQGNPRAYEFPRPLLRDTNDDFSFAGLKTSVRYFLERNPAVLNDDQSRRDLCASVQAAIVDVLVTKTIRAAKRLNVRCVTASGGVTCNSRLRQELQSACAREDLTLRLAERAVCTDNAAMIGILAERKLLRSADTTAVGDPDDEVIPTWAL
jgi:N6-L-threonylcarbamoyladenine synthase